MKNSWTYKKIKDICDKGSSNIQQNKIVGISGDYPVYGASGYVQNIDFYHQDYPYIGIVKDGSGVGRVNVYPAKTSLLGTMQYIIPKHGVSLGYVAYALKGLNLAKFASGAAIPHIYFRDYGECLIPVPSIEEQTAICSLLDNLNLVIEKKKQQIEELDNLTQSLFFDMFGDPVANDKGWSIDRLEANCEVSSAKRVLVEDVVESGIPFLRGTELTALSKSVSSKNVTFTMFITPEHYERVKAVTGVPKKGDILIPSINSEGITWVVDTDEPFYFKDGRVIWVHVNTNVFVSQYLSSAITSILKANYSLLTSGATFLELKLFIIRDLLVPISPLPLQQAFAEKVKAIERQKELINQSIKDVQTLFDAKMDYYFGD